MADVSVVVVTYNALPWVEQALGSVRGSEAIVVDHDRLVTTHALERLLHPGQRVVSHDDGRNVSHFPAMRA